jgi:hypothetical protein
MRGEMSKALGPERFVQEGLHEGSPGTKCLETRYSGDPVP